MILACTETAGSAAALQPCHAETLAYRSLQSVVPDGPLLLGAIRAATVAAHSVVALPAAPLAERSRVAAIENSTVGGEGVFRCNLADGRLIILSVSVIVKYARYCINNVKAQ
jgi:hypothetical protein